MSLLGIIKDFPDKNRGFAVFPHSPYFFMIILKDIAQTNDTGQYFRIYLKYILNGKE